MKTISVANQPWLSLRRTIAITMDGIRYRLFRATVTVAVIALAVAFMMAVLSPLMAELGGLLEEGE